MRAVNYFASLLACVSTVIVPVSGVVLHTSSRWILDSNNQRVKLRCANWAGHMETRIPEGLQHQSVEYIARWIAQNGFNCVRLTYSTDMALDPNQRVSDAFTVAASPAGVSVSSMQSLYNTAVSKNPWLSSATTQGTFGKVADALAAQNVLVILDNHVSRASWCCGNSDGNGWWAQASGYNADNSRYFDANNWLAGLRAMANFAKSHSNIVGMALRNELRAVGNQGQNNHADWYNYVSQGANAIHDTNADLLIVIGGVNYSIDLTFLYDRPFDRTRFPDKVVWEFHSYAWSQSIENCNQFHQRLSNLAGYLLTQGKSFTGPLWLSEFGWAQNGTPNDEVKYRECLVEYMKDNDAEWAYWALQGDYYVRDRAINKDETYGLLNGDWSGWRNSQFRNQLGSMFDVTQRP
ncbi:hypothetical protein AJ80_00349 [Polytolypa hystricis UAMH7299]|uniref:Glycoside hydrolase family 5 domain-containing protein n=1 Tax=Polytolypa hystricis (strain UAMH7299) TaxID=1447883 RepID=A0A2B7Z403_POLH7|nr:hypothetical protein AJ80_00349 [Polytolypa hystricis UAMH7299]